MEVKVYKNLKCMCLFNGRITVVVTMIMLLLMMKRQKCHNSLNYVVRGGLSLSISYLCVNRTHCVIAIHTCCGILRTFLQLPETKNCCIITIIIINTHKRRPGTTGTKILFLVSTIKQTKIICCPLDLRIKSSSFRLFIAESQEPISKDRKKKCVLG